MTKETQDQHIITTDLKYRDTDNNNISMMVHKSGRGTVMIHSVKGVTVGALEKLQTKDNKVVSTKRITVKQEDGKVVNFILFFDN